MFQIRSVHKSRQFDLRSGVFKILLEELVFRKGASPVPFAEMQLTSNFYGFWLDFSVQLSQQTFLVFQDVFKTSTRCLQRNTFRLPRRLQDVFAIRLLKTSSRRLQDVFARRLAIMSSRRLQYVLTKTNVCWVVRAPFFRTLLCRCFHFIYSLVMKSLWNKISYLHFLIFWGKH